MNAVRYWFLLTMPERLRERQNRRRENHGNHAAGIDPQRKVRRLSAKNATPDDALGILNRNATLAAFHQNDERDNDNHQGEHDDHQQDVPGAG